jgi:integrase/recombinase XerD
MLHPHFQGIEPPRIPGRITELTGLRIGDLQLGTGAHVRCLGKGRKHRCTPISKPTAALLRAWIQERGGAPDDPLFPTRRALLLTRSAVGCLVAKHAATAAQHCPSLKAKRPTPHALRQTCAMSLLAAGCDTSVIALWLGHEQSSTTDRITSTATCPSNRKHSTGHDHATSSPAAIAPPTPCSPSSPASDTGIMCHHHSLQGLRATSRSPPTP